MGYLRYSKYAIYEQDMKNIEICLLCFLIYKEFYFVL